MKVLFFGDVVGEPGLRALEQELPPLLERFAPDFVVVNGENLDLTLPEQGRAGMTLASLERLFRLGVDAVTGGNHSLDPPDLEAILGHPRVLRPLNYSPLAPGRGSLLLEKGEKRLLVVNVAGRSALPLAVEDPLPALERTLAEGEGVPVLVDFHSESVFEKMAAAHALDGRIAALLGTHTHVPTADARILPRGTAYVSDVGMVGAEDGMLGYDPAFLVAAFRLRLPPRGLRLTYAKGPVRVSYVFLELNGTRVKAIVHASFLEKGTLP
uniref:YmdB family metallophosphoesterase n=1 Tax=Thermus islandicus TaxID=540988 RepID=A0A7C2C2V1_9DEIN